MNIENKIILEIMKKYVENDMIPDNQNTINSFLAIAKSKKLTPDERTNYQAVYTKFESLLAKKAKSNTQEKEQSNTQPKRNMVAPRVDIYSPQTIVVSDLHGDMNKWNIIKEKLKIYPNYKFIIEGDAMDKGAFGIDILLEIKELSDLGRVKYLPGNHDTFTYNYFKSKGTPHTEVYNSALKHLQHNGGQSTIDCLENFDTVLQSALENGRIHKLISKEALMEWLGKQPIQTIIKENNVNYALAHAMFDTKLYNKDPYFNMEKAYALQTKSYLVPEEFDTLNRFYTCMWYRENDPKTHFAEFYWPQDHIVVVGHTTQQQVNIQEINGDPRKQIIYVDCHAGNFQGYNLTTLKHVSLEQSKNNEEKSKQNPNR